MICCHGFLFNVAHKFSPSWMSNVDSKSPVIIRGKAMRWIRWTVQTWPVAGIRKSHCLYLVILNLCNLYKHVFAAQIREWQESARGRQLQILCTSLKKKYVHSSCSPFVDTSLSYMTKWFSVNCFLNLTVDCFGGGSIPNQPPSVSCAPFDS